MVKPSIAESLILAGGLGTRLRSAVNDRPKPIAMVAGRPFIEKLLAQLVRHKYRKAVLCVGYKADQVQATLGNSFGPLALAYSSEDIPLGTAGALRKATELTEAPDLLIMNGDSFCDLDLTAFSESHRRFGARATIAVVYRQDRSSAGVVEIEKSGRLVRFDARPNTSDPGLINAGIYMIRRDVLLAIPCGHISLESDILPGLVSQGEVFGYEVFGDFIDIGTPDTYDVAQTFFDKK